MAQSSGGIGEILKWGLILGGAYYLYQAYVNSQATAAAAAAPVTPATPATTTTSTTAPTFSLQSLITAIQDSLTTGASTSGTTAPVVAPPTAPAPVANESQTASAMIDAASGLNSLNVDQWNYYWGRLGGVVLTAAQSNAVATAAGGDNPMDVNAYISARGAAGLDTTLPGLSGLGAVPLPVPLAFIYGPDKRPLLLIPGGR